MRNSMCDMNMSSIERCLLWQQWVLSLMNKQLNSAVKKKRTATKMFTCTNLHTINKMCLLKTMYNICFITFLQQKKLWSTTLIMNWECIPNFGNLSQSQSCWEFLFLFRCNSQSSTVFKRIFTRGFKKYEYLRVLGIGMGIV